MLRLLLIAALFIQLLVAQAAVADVACVHALAEHTSADAPHATASQDGQSHCDCLCDITSHCSSSAISSGMRMAGNDLPLRSDKPAMATHAIARGYRTHPYRPPPPRHS